MIRGVYRSDQIYSGNATALAPDLIIGYARGYRASWDTVEGNITDEVLLDNDSPGAPTIVPMPSKFPAFCSAIGRFAARAQPDRCGAFDFGGVRISHAHRRWRGRTFLKVEMQAAG